MRYQSIVAAALSAAAVSATEGATGKLGDAAAIQDNPVGVTYVAKLPEKAFTPIDVGGNIKGSVSATACEEGKGVEFKVKFSNLPKEGGPYGFHLHDSPVPEDGNCTLTKAHLDPYQRGPDPACDSKKPETCEVGDLSGKHGKIPAGVDTFETTFTDFYASTKEGIGAFFGNRSVVIHYANSSRITCANFALLEGDDDGKPGHGHGDDDDEDCEDDGDHDGGDGEDDGGDDGEDGGDDGETTPPPAETTPPSNGTTPPPPQDSAPIEVPGAAAATAASLFAAFAAAMFAL